MALIVLMCRLATNKQNKQIQVIAFISLKLIGINFIQVSVVVFIFLKLPTSIYSDSSYCFYFHQSE